MDMQKMFGCIILVMAIELQSVAPDWIQLPVVERDDKNLQSKLTAYSNSTNEKKKDLESNINTLPSNEVDSTLKKSPTDKIDKVHRKVSSEETFVKLTVKLDESEPISRKTTKDYDSNDLISSSQQSNEKSISNSLNVTADQKINAPEDNPAFNYNSSILQDNFGLNFIYKMERENLSSPVKPVIPTMGVNWSGNIPPFDILRSVHQTLINEIPNSMKEKRKFLQKLQNRMFNYMEKRIKHLWTSESMRQSRTDKGMSFPSLEGALMSISFLIFAVFLIKLVQQLIHKLQGENMSVRQQRLMPDLLTTARIMKLVDEFPYQYHKMEDQS